MAARLNLNLEIPEKLTPFLEPARYKVAHGGRGSAKSWTVARLLLVAAMQKRRRILCTRQFQNSIADSVHQVLSTQIEQMGLARWFDVGQKTITCTRTGSEFLFKGLYGHVQEIKSLEGIDIAWAEEASSVSEESWNVLIPTIRKEGSEIWITFNPDLDSDPTYKRFVLNPPPGAVVIQVNWSDNPWFPKALDEERRYKLRVDPGGYDNVWEGHTRLLTAASVFAGKFEIRPFEAPEKIDRLFFGADFGFAKDPSTLVRCYIVGNTLYIDHEAYGVGVEIDAMPAFYDRVPEVRNWPIIADSARPETISYLSRQGFSIRAAKKWSGSVEDGISHIKGFDQVVIHERCVHTAQEFRLYSYKTDPRTGDILPVVLDRDNHTIDALRYALDGYIAGRGGLGIWARLAG